MLRYPALIAAALMATSPALAQQDPAADYPNRPVKIIVSVPAGGGVDTVTRIFAARLQQRLGQPFVIENRGGGGGNIGAEAVYTAEPDGYTLLATQPAPITSNIALYKKLNFDPVALEPVAVMSKFPNVLLVRQDFPAKTVQEFIAYAKANPGKVTYASQGPGTTSHLTAELFAKATGTKMLHVPYRGTGPALNDLVAGHVDFIFMELASGHKLHDAGKARILAVATEKRLDMLAGHSDLDRGRVARVSFRTPGTPSARRPRPRLRSSPSSTARSTTSSTSPTPRRGSASSTSWPPAAARRTWRSSRRRRPSAGPRSSAMPASSRSKPPAPASTAGISAYAMMSGVSWSSIWEMRSRR